MTENEMATLRPHVITPACPLTCIERQLPAKAYQAVRRHLEGVRVFHPAVRHVVALYQHSGLAGIRGLGAQGVELTTALLETAGLIPPRPDRAGQQTELELLKRLAG